MISIKCYMLRHDHSRLWIAAACCVLLPRGNFQSSVRSHQFSQQSGDGREKKKNNNKETRWLLEMTNNKLEEESESFPCSLGLRAWHVVVTSLSCGHITTFNQRAFPMDMFYLLHQVYQCLAAIFKQSKICHFYHSPDFTKWNCFFQYFWITWSVCFGGEETSVGNSAFSTNFLNGW